ncbi:MAG: Ger(x)C family spore germination protein [Syntrophomonadaceae bacterium]|nr:Ger(x)C family spore germination protein [Syntrophomonadaceae bacterium]
MNKSFFLSSLILLIFLSGCQSLDVNETSVAIGLGLDWEASQNQFRFSAQLAKPIAAGGESSEDDEDAFIVVSETGETAFLAARNLTLILPRFPLWPHASTAILGENIAQKDAALYIDSLVRNPNIRKNVGLVVCTGTTPEQLMQVKTPLEPLSALGITKIIDIQQRLLGIYAPITIGEFTYKLSTPGIEPLVPIATVVKTEDSEVIKIDGSAAFSERRMVGKLNEKESRGYHWLVEDLQAGGIITIPSPDNPQKFVTLEIIKTQAKVKPCINDKGEIIINIKLTADGNFYEQQTTEQLLNLKNFKTMEKIAAEEIEKEIAQAIIRAQELNSDIFGFGQNLSKCNPKAWRKIEDNWYHYFSDIKTNIEVDFRLRRSYLTNSSFKFS